MKQINNNCVEVLPSLLDKTKVQTIRYIKPFSNTCIYPEGASGLPPSDLHLGLPKYKVGETVELIWKKDNEYDWFWGVCGDPIRCKCKVLIKDFKKHLGKAIITEVLEISLQRLGNNNYLLQYGTTIWEEEVEYFAKLDGFKSTEQMFKYFDKNYSLSTPKRFYVYRWRWLV